MPYNMGGDIWGLIYHAIIWNVILIMIEANLFEFLSQWYCGHEIVPKKDLAMDEDVEDEEDRVDQNEDERIRVHKLRKVYTQCMRRPFLAVERVSFGLNYGECFTLLGVNGAGKTTCFKSLTNEVQPTNGMITINGEDVNSRFYKVRKSIGFCP